LQRTKRILLRGDVKDTAPIALFEHHFPENPALTFSAHPEPAATPTRRWWPGTENCAPVWRLLDVLGTAI